MVGGDGLRQRADMQTMSTPSANQVREPLAASASGGRPRMRLRPREARLIVGASYDVAALMLATGLSVFKPRRRHRAREVR